MFRNIPTITKNLLIVNFLAFVATWVLQYRGIDLAAIGGLHFFMASDFHLYQFITYLFLHANFTHILFNMFALWMFGVVVENVWGPKKFLFYYISCGIGAGFMQEIVQFFDFYFRISAQDPNVGFADLFIIGCYEIVGRFGLKVLHFDAYATRCLTATGHNLCTIVDIGLVAFSTINHAVVTCSVIVSFLSIFSRFSHWESRDCG